MTGVFYCLGNLGSKFCYWQNQLGLQIRFKIDQHKPEA